MSMAIVVEASQGNSRLPEGVLTKLAGRPLLEHVVSRLRASGLPIIVAASNEAADDALESVTRELGVSLYRGDQLDVLARVIGAADAFGVTEVVRVGADQPAIDAGGVERISELRRRVHADHAVECGLPHGAAVEAVTVAALRRSRDLVSDPYDLQNVTSFLRRDARFTAMRAVAPGHLRRPGLRLTVQNAQEAVFMDGVLSATPTPAPDAPLDEIIAVAEAAVVRLERARLTATRKGA